jgi:predicted AAA+ superfamily ATPase
LRSGGQESGQGRWDELCLEGLSLREFVAFSAGPEESVDAAFRRAPNLIERYLVAGGFPEHALNSDLPEVRRRLRGDIADRAIRRDLSRFGVDVERVGRLFTYLVENSGSIFSAPARARDLEADPRSIREWLHLLLNTQLLVRLEREHGGAAARLRSEPRIYAADPGLISAFSAAVSAGDVRGRLFEAAVFRHLRDAARELRGHLSYYRSHDGLEIDFLVRVGSRVIGIEAKSATRVRREEIDHLRQAATRLGVSRSLLVHGGVLSERARDVGLVSLATFLMDPVAALQGEAEGRVDR